MSILPFLLLSPYKEMIFGASRSNHQKPSKKSKPITLPEPEPYRLRVDLIPRIEKLLDDKGIIDPELRWQLMLDIIAKASY